MSTPVSTESLYINMNDVSNIITKLAISSQFKVSLNLNRGGSDGDLHRHLTRCGIFDNLGASYESYDLLCSQASLPSSTNFILEERGSRQGVIEKFATYRVYDNFSLTFYIDNQYNIIRLFEEWMNFINPIHNNQGRYGGEVQGQRDYRDRNNYYKFRYPNQYKRNIVVTKFDRAFYGDASLSFTSRINRGNPNDTQIGENFTPQEVLCFDFIDCFPSNLVAIPLSYDGSAITKVSVEFQYLRYNTITNSMTDAVLFSTQNFFGD